MPLELDPVRLRFRDAGVEASYRARSQPARLRQCRLGIAVGLVLYCGYGALDAFLAGGVPAGVWAVRYLIGAPLVLGCLALTWLPAFRRRLDLVITLTMQIVGVSIIAQMSLLPTPGTSYYFAGLITAIVFAACVLRPFPVWAGLNCALFTLEYLAFGALTPEVADPWFVNNAGFLVVNSIACVFAAYMFELRTRQLYVRDQHLRVQLDRAQQLRAQADRANALKSRFIATASHELRTPLNAVVGFAELMANEIYGPLGDERYREYAGMIHDSSSHLLTTVNDLLDVSKAQANTPEIAREAVELNALVRTAVKEIRPQAADKGLDVEVRETAEPLVVELDPRLVRRAFANLLANAVKFTDRGGVRAAVRRAEDDAPCVDVVDTGQGIPAAERDAVFESFTHGASGDHRGTSGAGLGLALVRQIVRMHAGEIHLASAPGEGTRFTLVFPAAGPSEAAAGAA